MGDKQTLTTQEIVDRLSEINKDELSERQFFQEVLSVIKDMKDFDLTEENFVEISKTLREIGCVNYETWKEEKEELGFSMQLKPSEQGNEEGLLATGEKYIDSYLSDYSKAKYVLQLMTEEREKSGLVQSWLRNSQKVLRGDKTNSDLEFEFYEAELKERKKAELELGKNKARKDELTAEINEVKEKIESELEAKNELNIENSQQSKGLDEK